MTTDEAAGRAFDCPGLYVISVQGRLPPEASRYLNNLKIMSRETQGQLPVAILTGELSDQAALLGVLNALYERGYTVLNVNRIEAS